MFSKNDYITFYTVKASNARNMAAVAKFKGLHAEAQVLMDNSFTYRRQADLLAAMSKYEFYRWADARCLPHKQPKFYLPKPIRPVQSVQLEMF